MKDNSNSFKKPVLEYCKQNNIAFIPWFPLGGGDVKGYVTSDSKQKKAIVHQIALSWLLHHSDNILVITGTSNVIHLEENMKIASIQLAMEDMEELNQLV